MAIIEHDGIPLLHGRMIRVGLKARVVLCYEFSCEWSQLVRLWFSRNRTRSLKEIDWVRFEPFGWFCPLCSKKRNLFEMR